MTISTDTRHAGGVPGAELRRQLTSLPTLPAAKIVLPEPVARLRDVAYDLWWSWCPAAARLFAWIDPDRWRRCHNPVQLLIDIEPGRWTRLLGDVDFLESYAAVIQAFDVYRARPRWFDEHVETFPGPVAYFSMEFGVHESLGIYSGGLGVLAGDHCKAASDLGVPLVGVGLLYQSGYFRQTVDADGFQQHIYPNYDFGRLAVLPVRTPADRWLTVTIELPGRVVHAAVWKIQVGLVPILMLDTDIPLNDPSDRPISGILYVRSREMRLCQEIVLGVGGVRALNALGITPAVWHMNEGHVAFFGLERARQMVLAGQGVRESLSAVGRDTVFTTHTPVPAGNETYDMRLARRYLEAWVRDVRCDPQTALALGAENNSFNLTALSIRLSSSTNGVSRLHGDVTRDMWRHLWPDQTCPVSYVTNGVHTSTWIGSDMRALYSHHLSPEWEEHLADSEFWARVREIPNAELWAAHHRQKERLIRFVRDRVRWQAARHGVSPEDLRAVDGLLDPRAITLGFARRFTSYKRAILVLSDMQRLRALLSLPERPVQILFSGKAHPADREGQEAIRRLFLLAQDEFRGRIVYIEDYDMEVGRLMTQGCDVWLNTPRRPHEASGTSGQKAPINGGLNVSILDGWWAEGFAERNGWAIGDGRTYSTQDVQDREDAESLYQVLEQNVVPCFYDRGDDNLPHAWITMMKRSIETVVPQFSACRMLHEYVEKIYRPAAQRHASIL